MTDDQKVFDLFPVKPDEGATSSDEVFKCWNCGAMYPTDGEFEGQCPVCGETCTSEICTVVYASNEDY